MLTATFVLRLLLALTCVVGLIWYIGRRFGNGGPQQRTTREPGVKIVGRQSMGKHTGVAVVAVGQRRILVGYGEQQVSMLTELGPVFDELPAPRATVSADAAAPAPTPWVSVARATKAAAAGLLPTQRSRKPAATPKAITPESLAAVGVSVPAPAPAPKALDASPIDRLDQDAWPTFASTAPAPAVPAPAPAVSAPAPAPAVSTPTPAPAVSTPTPAPAVSTPAPSAPVAEPTASDDEDVVATSDAKPSALAGSILAPDTWKQAVRSLQDRTVRR